jgi:hypothetical protein
MVGRSRILNAVVIKAATKEVSMTSARFTVITKIPPRSCVVA